jgi:hypothetical protein
MGVNETRQEDHITEVEHPSGRKEIEVLALPDLEYTGALDKDESILNGLGPVHGQECFRGEDKSLTHGQ